MEKAKMKILLDSADVIATSGDLYSFTFNNLYNGVSKDGSVTIKNNGVEKETVASGGKVANIVSALNEYLDGSVTGNSNVHYSMGIPSNLNSLFNTMMGGDSNSKADDAKYFDDVEYYWLDGAFRLKQ